MTVMKKSASSQRRKLRFNTIPEAIAEAERIAALERAGAAHYAGNWNAGQIFNHLGAWAEYAFTGIPLRPPWFIRPFMRLMRGSMLRGMSAGRRIPNVKEGTLATEPADLETGFARFKAAFERLDRESPPPRHPFFGPMAHQDWKRLNLNHAELHFSFVKN